MLMKKSDVLDRWSILLMKSRVEKNAKKELKRFSREAKTITGMNIKMLELLMALMEQNAKIWCLEYSIRLGMKRDFSTGTILGPGEIGRRALAIREHNRTRVEIKSKLDAMFGEISDTKVMCYSARMGR